MVEDDGQRAEGGADSVADWAADGESHVTHGDPRARFGGEDGLELRLELVQELKGHADRVWSLAWNRDSGALASCSGDKSVRVWERQRSGSGAESWTCAAVLDETHTRTVRSCEWAPRGGRLLATASFDATVGIWGAGSGAGQWECVASLEGHENEVKSVAWNATGTLLATCSRDKHVWIWEVQPGDEFECVSVLAGHSQDVKMVAWHPAQDVLVSASYDNSIKVWKEDGDGDDWQCVQTLAEPGPGHTSTVWAVSFNAEGDRMVSCSDDLTLMIWDTTPSSGIDHTPWRHLHTISGYHDRTVFSVHWSEVNGLIASAAGDDCIRIFAVEDGKHAMLADEGNNFSLVGKKRKAHSTDVNCVRWHPTDPRLLASTSDDGIVKIWKVVGDIKLCAGG